MSSLPILALLLLLAYRTLPAQGYPIDYITLIKEMRDLLNQTPVLPKGDLQTEDIFILQNKNFLRTNLEKFLEAAENFKNKTEQIMKILPEFRTVLPTASSTEDSISIDENDWDDFRRKLKKYLDSLLKFVRAKISV
ncbi:interleukin-3 [Glossophaga mutica]